jgi:hypothetical protein
MTAELLNFVLHEVRRKPVFCMPIYWQPGVKNMFIDEM